MSKESAPSLAKLVENIPNAAAVTAGKGLVLPANGVLPPSVVAPNPVDGYLASYNAATAQTKWIAPTPPVTLIAPTHLPGVGQAATNVAVVANTAYLMPIANVVTPTTISRIAWSVVTVVAGNYDVGIYYSDDESTFTRLVSKGSTAIPAAGAVITSITSTVITPVAGRRWYYALAMSTASTVVVTQSGGAAVSPVVGYSKAASFALPASLTGMAASGAVAPVLNGAV